MKKNYSRLCPIKYNVLSFKNEIYNDILAKHCLTDVFWEKTQSLAYIICHCVCKDLFGGIIIVTSRSTSLHMYVETDTFVIQKNPWI